MTKDIREQVRMDKEDSRLLERLLKTRRYGSTKSEVFRRGLKCLEEEEERRASRK